MDAISPTSADSAAAIIAARGVKKHYGRIRAVDGVDLDVHAGELFGLIGHNGAGKSTMFKMMLGLIPASAGEIRIDGALVGSGGGDFRAVRRRIGYLPENVVLYDNLTGLETLQFFARLKGVRGQNDQALLEKVGLAHAARRRVREYSKGMRQRLGFAQALLGNPRLLFLDEPTTGLDPDAIRGFYAILRELKDEGVTMVITSHILAEIQERVDRLAIMVSGKVEAVGTVHSLREAQALPVWLHVYADAADHDHIRQAVAGVPIVTVEERGDFLALQCPRELKMKALAALTATSGKVHDLIVREPSLEDVFFGFSD